MTSINIEDDKDYKIIVDKKTDIKNIIIINKIMENDIYSKYDIVVRGELFITPIDEINKKKRKYKSMIEESYEQYLLMLSKVSISNTKWIYNIIDGKSEQKDIIYSDNIFLLIPTYTSSKNKDMTANNFHILAIPKRKDIKSIRDLDSTHIDMLEHILNKTIIIIKDNYNIDKSKLKIYFHYPPSTWHLHIHFSTIENTCVSSSIEYSYQLYQVIFNLKLCSEYYKKINLFTYI
jgi:m7GpppX diphosphatase